MKKLILSLMLLFAPFVTQAMAQHSVALSWTASTSTTVTHYGVYRGTTSGGPYVYLGYTKNLSYVNSKNPDGTPLADNSVFYYVVVAFTDPDPATGKSSHSPNSNEFKAVIPVTVVIAPATNLTATAQ